MNSSTRKQKAKEKRSRQSDVLSDIDNMDLMQESFPEHSFERQEKASKIEVHLESRRPYGDANQIEDNFRLLLNTGTSENSEITAETRRAVILKIFSQMSKKLEELRIDLI